MSTPENSKREHPSTYVVQDRSNEEELTRVKFQDQMMTTAMGGPLPEQPDSSLFRRVLDVGCGTGNWLMETARSFPTIQVLIGVDISIRMVDYARQQSEDDASLAQRVQFSSMDALRLLEFQDHFFDLVNERFAVSYLRTWDWDKFLRECIRVTRHGGVVRFTESQIAADSNSPALNQLNSFMLQAFYGAGHLWTLDRNSVISELPNQFSQHGLQDIHTRAYNLSFHAGTEQGDLFVADMARGYRTVLPFLKKWTKLPDTYEEIYQQALREMQRPDFEASQTLLTIWGTTPRKSMKPPALRD